MSEYKRLFSVKVPYTMPMRAQAIVFATAAHSGQFDKSGAPYIYHPLTVMMDAERAGLDIISVVSGVLHDVVEDTDVTLMEVEHHFGGLVAETVDALTRRVLAPPAPPGELGKFEKETYQDFLNRIAAVPRARRIKLLDIRHNMRPDRKVPGLTDLNGRYVKAREFLANKMLQKADPVDFKFLAHLGVIETLSDRAWKFIGFDHWDAPVVE